MPSADYGGGYSTTSYGAQGGAGGGGFMGGSQGGSQGAAGKVTFGHTGSLFLFLADLVVREHMAKTPSDPSP